MGTGDANSELMSLQVSFNDGLHIDVDDAIGGATAFDPGHCLSLLTEAERDAYLLAECMDEAGSCDASVDREDLVGSCKCNVTIEADDTDTDGNNDAWRIDTFGPVTALICQDSLVIGKTTLTFGFDAVENQ